MYSGIRHTFRAVIIMSGIFLTQVPVFSVGENDSGGKIFKEYAYTQDHIRCALRGNRKKDGELRVNNYPDMMEFYLYIDDLDRARAV